MNFQYFKNCLVRSPKLRYCIFLLIPSAILLTVISIISFYDKSLIVVGLAVGMVVHWTGNYVVKKCTKNKTVVDEEYRNLILNSLNYHNEMDYETVIIERDSYGDFHRSTQLYMIALIVNVVVLLLSVFAKRCLSYDINIILFSLTAVCISKCVITIFELWLTIEFEIRYDKCFDKIQDLNHYISSNSGDEELVKNMNLLANAKNNVNCKFAYPNLIFFDYAENYVNAIFSDDNETETKKFKDAIDCCLLRIEGSANLFDSCLYSLGL